MFVIILLEPFMFVETLFMKIDDFNFHCGFPRVEYVCYTVVYVCYTFKRNNDLTRFLVLKLISTFYHFQTVFCI